MPSPATQPASGASERRCRFREVGRINLPPPQTQPSAEQLQPGEAQTGGSFWSQSPLNGRLVMLSDCLPSICSDLRKFDELPPERRSQITATFAKLFGIPDGIPIHLNVKYDPKTNSLIVTALDRNNIRFGEYSDNGRGENSSANFIDSPTIENSRRIAARTNQAFKQYEEELSRGGKKEECLARLQGRIESAFGLRAADGSSTLVLRPQLTPKVRQSETGVVVDIGESQLSYDSKTKRAVFTRIDCAQIAQLSELMKLGA